MLLRPSRVINEIFLYVLAVAARRYRICVHAFCVMSNHYHLVLTDPDAQLPAFVQYLDSLVARATNTWLGRWEGFWSSDTSYSAVSHDAAPDIVGKISYVLANPVAAGLVRSAREWPGLWTAPEQLGSATFVARRPGVFFRADGDMPEVAELTLTTPHGFASAEELRHLVDAELAALEEKSRREMGAARRSFLGRSRVLAQNPFARAESEVPRRALNPRVAARDKWKRVEALARLVGFVRAYRTARAAMQSGIRDVIFPAGTYLLRIQHGVMCAEYVT